MGQPKFPSLSVFFPAYNDAPSLPGLIADTFAVLRDHMADYEVIVINDGSQDETGRVLEQLRQAYAPYMRVVGNQGVRLLHRRSAVTTILLVGELRTRCAGRALLQKLQLTSTSGTICVELVRKLELRGCVVVETGVHHHPRMHGTSQFFPLRSLAATFLELLRLWVRLVVLK